MQKRQCFQQMLLGTLAIYMQKEKKMKFIPYLISHTKIKSKQIKDLNISPKGIKLLEGNIMQNLYDH